MRFVKLAAFLIIAALAFPCHTSAATFTDDMLMPQNTAETQYSALKPYAGATYGLSDQTLLTFADNSSPQGHALYRANAAETVTVGIYTSYGTCVSQQEIGLLLGKGTKQALRSKSKDSIYSDFSGSFWRIELDFESRYDPVFSPVNALPDDVDGFGLNIYALPGPDKALPVSVTKSISEALCYEEYTAVLPAGTQYIKVEINDVTSYPMKGGGTMPNRVYTSLASVRISGEALVMGKPAKVEQQPTVTAPSKSYDDYDEDEDEDEDEEESEIYSAAFSAVPTPDLSVDFEPESEHESPASSEKSSSSKFEGTITSSSKQQKPQSPKSDPPQSESSSKSSVRSESAPSKEEPPREAVYEIRRESSDNGMRSGVTIYIIIVSAALFLVLIFGVKRQ